MTEDERQFTREAHAHARGNDAPALHILEESGPAA
jgi:hypothetical protein